jgi:steroid 5-alpha reductase family enzyme
MVSYDAAGQSSTAIPGDVNFLLLTAIVTIFYQLLFYFIAAFFKSDRVTDLAGGTNFVILALLSFFLGAAANPPISQQQYAMTILVIVWGVRLSAFLFYRILMIGTDHRFDEMRDHPIQFLYFWIFQMIWVWIVSLPIVYLNSKSYYYLSYYYLRPLGTSDLAGIILAGVGLIIESVADQTKFYFK